MTDFAWDPDSYLALMAEEIPDYLADLVVPPDPADVVTPVDGVTDLPSSAEDQLTWLRQAGFTAQLHWRHRDLAVLSATA